MKCIQFVNIKIESKIEQLMCTTCCQCKNGINNNNRLLSELEGTRLFVVRPWILSAEGAGEGHLREVVSVRMVTLAGKCNFCWLDWGILGKKKN